MSENDKVIKMLLTEIAGFLRRLRATKRQTEALSSASHKLRGGLAFSGFREHLNQLKTFELAAQDFTKKLLEAEQLLDNIKKVLKTSIK